MRSAARISVATALSLIVAGAVAPRALAHANLEFSEPADNSVLASAPRAVRLVFSEPIVPRFSTARIVDLAGREVRGVRVRTDPGHRMLVLSAPRLPRGTYTVSWRVLSADDAHLGRGLIVFGVGERIDPRAAAASSQQNAPLPPIDVTLRWLNYSFFAALVGALAIAALIVPAAGRAQRRVLRWATLTGGLALATGVALLLQEAHSVPGRFGNALWDLLARTRWGSLWLAREAILLALVVLLMLLRGGSRRVYALTAFLLAAALMAVQALTSHAAGLASSSGLAVATDALHLLAGGVWIGGLVALAVGLWPLRGAEARDCLKRFGALAALSVGVLAATGLYSIGRQVASLDALLTTAYGQALMSKVGLMLVAAAIGFTNFMLLRGRLFGVRTRVPTLVAAEASLGLLVLVAAAVLTTAVPARGHEFAPAPKNVASILVQSQGDLLVTLSVQPNRPGDNLFQVLAASTRRPPPAEIARVSLRLSGPQVGRSPVTKALQPIGSGRYRLAGDVLRSAGDARIDVIIQRPGLGETVAPFAWRVAPASPPRPVLVSNRPLGPILTRAAAGLGLMLLLLAAGAVLWRRWIPTAAQPAQKTR